jgi:hypothetical protein
MVMRLARPIFLSILTVVLAAYAFDCGAMTTPEQAMQCCDTMPCSSHGHAQSEDCCKTMPSMHAAFVQPASVNGVSFASVVIAFIPASDVLGTTDSSMRVIAAHCNAPPTLSALVPLPLRL